MAARTGRITVLSGSDSPQPLRADNTIIAGNVHEESCRNGFALLITKTCFGLFCLRVLDAGTTTSQLHQKEAKMNHGYSRR
jgi:hypothetical protein